jgi:hypothetical protein
VCSDDIDAKDNMLNTLEEVMAAAAEEEEAEEREREEEVDFELSADASLEIEGGELRLDGTSSVKGTVTVDGSSVIVCGRGSKVDMTSDGEEDDTSNASEEVSSGEVASSSDDETDETPRTKVDGTMELEEGARLEVDSLTIGATGVVSGTGDLEIKMDPRTVAVVEEKGGGGGRRLNSGETKKWRTKRSNVKISSSDVLDEETKTKVKNDRIKKKKERRARVFLKRNKGVVSIDTVDDEDLLKMVKEMNLNVKDDGVTMEDDDALMTREKMIERLSDAKSQQERSNKMAKVGKRSARRLAKEQEGLTSTITTLDLEDKEVMIEEGMRVLGASTTALERAKATKDGVAKKDLSKIASKYWRYVRIMKKRGVKRTRGATEDEKTSIRKYAKEYVLKKFQEGASEDEKTLINSKISAVKTALGSMATTEYPEEDEVVERIALWDELREVKEDGEASIKVAGRTTISEGAGFQLEPRAVVSLGEMNAKRGSSIIVGIGSKMNIGRDDDEVDDEIDDGSGDLTAGSMAVELGKDEAKKMFEVEEGATMTTEAESTVEVERLVRCDGDVLVRGKMTVQKDDAASTPEEEEEVEVVGVVAVESDEVVAPKGTFKLADGAELAGVGTVQAKTIEVTSGSFLRPGNSPGTMTMDGDVVLDSESHVQFEIMDTVEDQYDLLRVSGKMLLGGTMNVEAGDSCLMPVAVITTQEGLESEFDHFNTGETEGASGSKSEDGYDYLIGCATCEANQHVVRTGESMGTVSVEQGRHESQRLLLFSFFFFLSSSPFL